MKEWYEKREKWRETVLADIDTPTGTVAIDTRAGHCGNCEYCRNCGSLWAYCGIFFSDLDADREKDGFLLDWKRCGSCLSSQTAAA